MNCPYCNEELEYHDWFGINMKLDGSGNKKGNIYICKNENCEMFEQYFFDRNDGELREGYPC